MHKQKRGLFVAIVFVIVLLAILSLFSNKSLVGYLLYPIANKEACTQDYIAETDCIKTFSGSDCSSNDYPTVYSPWDYTYCSSNLACVHKYKCYSHNSMQTISGKTVFCNANKWFDFDNRKLACEGTDDCKRTISITNKPATWKWAKAGSYNVGEYDDTINPECCGDDANEYVVTGTDGTTACCSKPSTDSFPVKVVNGMCVYKLGPWNSYVGGSAVNTWATPFTHKGGTQNFRVYEEGKLLEPRTSPWSNTELGIFSDFRRELETHVYIAPTEAIDSNTRTYEMHSCISKEIYGDGYDNDCDGTIDKPLEFYGYWQLNVGRQYNNQQDEITALEDMEATRDYTNVLFIKLDNNNRNRENIKNFINYAYNNDLILLFQEWEREDADIEKSTTTLNNLKNILDGLNDSLDTDDIPNVYDKIFGFEVLEEPEYSTNCGYMIWWIDEFKQRFPKQKIFVELGGADSGKLIEQIEKCKSILSETDYIEFFSYPYKKNSICDNTADVQIIWNYTKDVLEFLKKNTNKPIIYIGEAAGYTCSDVPSGAYNLIIPTTRQTRSIYDFAKSDKQFVGLLWYIYRKEEGHEGVTLDGYGAHGYPIVIEEYKNIWAEEQKKASCC